MESLSQFQMNSLKQELNVLRDRIEYLEKLLSLNEPSAQSLLCAFCQGTHPIRLCEYYGFLQVGDRWRVAKKLGLCYRCLDNTDGHLGKYCPKTRICRIRGCRHLHHRLLHDPDRRKFRAERHHVAKCVEPSSSDSGVQNGYAENLTDSEFSGFIEPAVTPVSSSGAHSIETDSLDLTEATSAPCDSENDSQQIEELNRLAMLAEKEVPFDLVFSGSCRTKRSLKRVYVTSAPSGDSIDSFSFGDLVATEGKYDLSKPSRGDMNGINEPEYSSTGAPFDHVNDTAGLDTFDETENPHAGTYVTCDGNMNSDKMDSVTTEDHDPVSSSVRSGEDNNSAMNVIDSKADDVDLFVPETTNDDYSWLTTRMEKEVQLLSQKYRTNDNTLLDTLSNQINRLDKEILFYETIVSPDPPAERADKTLEPTEKMNSLDLSFWLMPEPGGSQKC